jgi:hypothetical protein
MSVLDAPIVSIAFPAIERSFRGSSRTTIAYRCSYGAACAIRRR